MSTKLQQRALQLTDDQETSEPSRFTSMVVPIDRAARPEATPEMIVELPAPVLHTLTSASPAQRAPWLPIAATLVTGLLLLPILCLALFPVSMMALVLTPLVGVLYAGSVAFRREDKPRASSDKSSSIPISRAA